MPSKEELNRLIQASEANRGLLCSEVKDLRARLSLANWRLVWPWHRRAWYKLTFRGKDVPCFNHFTD
jgi:hypothetical protein